MCFKKCMGHASTHTWGFMSPERCVFGVTGLCLDTLLWAWPYQVEVSMILRWYLCSCSSPWTGLGSPVTPALEGKGFLLAYLIHLGLRQTDYLNHFPQQTEIIYHLTWSRVQGNSIYWKGWAVISCRRTMQTVGRWWESVLHMKINTALDKMIV